MPNEVIRVEVEMRAREALQQFEKLDQQFRETAGSNNQHFTSSSIASTKNMSAMSSVRK